MLLNVVYELCLFVLSLILLPGFLFQIIFKKKYRTNFFQRLGFNFPSIKKNGRPLIWVHAVSLGEIKAVSTLVKLIHQRLDHPIILISSVTETGHKEARQSILADYHVYLPFDFYWIINRIVKRIAPDIVILCESDFWYNFLRCAKKQGANIAVVNGKMSERSTERFLKFPPFAQQLFNSIDLFCLQSRRYQKNFLSLSVPDECTVVTGNIKLDSEYIKLPPDEIVELQKMLGIFPSDKVIVFGSSHYPEENLLLQMMEKVWEKFPQTKAVIVPRHPERFNEVAMLIKKKQLPFHRLSEKSPNYKAKVVLIDGMGLLRKCYQIADVAIVCGSYIDNVGGHNILEPLWYEIPSLFGPFMHNQLDIVDLILDYDAGKQVSIEQLPEIILNLLSDESLGESLGLNGRKLISDLKGATELTFKLLAERLPNFSRNLSR